MKLLYFTKGITISETFIYELAKGLSEKMDVQLVLASDPFYKDDLIFSKIDISVPKSIEHKLRYYFESRGKKIVYNWEQKRASKMMDNYVKNADVVYVDYGTTAVKLLPILIKYKKPFVVHFHGFDMSSALTFNSYRNDLKKLFHHCSSIIVPSFHAKRLAMLETCDENKIHVINYGASKAIQSAPSESTIEYDFLSVGRFTSKKNPKALIFALKATQSKHKDVKLCMIGDGPLLKDCKELVKKFDLERNVTFLGAMPNKEVLSFYSKVKIFLQHSVIASNGDQEGFPVSLIEAALMKLPIISTIHSGIPENVIDGKTGYLVREFDFETMAEKMIYLLENPEIAKQMGEIGKEHILTLCNTERRINQIATLLKSAGNTK